MGTGFTNAINQVEHIYLTNRLKHLLTSKQPERSQLWLDTAEAAIIAWEAANPYTYGHSSEVASISLYIARALQLSKTEQYKIKIAALLHDIGKIAIHSELVSKQPDDDVQAVKHHAVLGASLLCCNQSMQEIAEIVLFHHSHWDGTGYPENVAGTAIPIGSRIIAIANAYQTMTSQRPHHSSNGKSAALAKINRCAGSQFDPFIVKTFIQKYAKFYISL